MSEAPEGPLGPSPEATARQLLSEGLATPSPALGPLPVLELAEEAPPEPEVVALGTPLATEALPPLPEASAPATGALPLGPTVLVLGASSPLGRATARAFAELGYDLVVSARQASLAEAVAADLRLRHGVGVLPLELDPLAFHEHAERLQALLAGLGDRLVGALVAWGHHADPARAEQEASVLRRVLALNLVAPCSALEPLAAHLAARKTGFLAAYCPLEGLQGSERHRAWGAAKAGLSAYLRGLRHRLGPQGVHVATVWVVPLDSRPGAKAKAPSPLTVARLAVRAIRRGEDEPVLPPGLAWRAAAQRHLPMAWWRRWWP